MSRFVSEPLEVIDEILSLDLPRTNIRNQSSISHVPISRAFEEWLSDSDNLSQVPLLSLENLLNHPESFQPHKLVRFRGMVQDTSFGQEVYITRYTSGSNWKYNCYRDFSPEAFDVADVNRQSILNSPPASMDDRDLWYVVSTPGLSSWAKDSNLPETTTTDYPNNNIMIRTHNPKYPIPNQPHLGIIIKLYGNDSNRPRANVTDLVDMVGILGSNYNNQDIVLHVVALQKIVNWEIDYNPWNNNPLLNSSGSNTRSQLLSCLTQVLGGDDVAGELLLMHLFGRLPKAERMIDASNRFTVLNLVLPRGFDKISLYTTLENLLPIVQSYHMTIANLNNDQLLPTFQDNGGLHSGILQLPPATYLVVDETEMVEGHLNERGVKNLQGLTDLATNAQLTYHYPYFQTAITAPMSMLILSTTVKSLTPAQFHVALAPGDVTLSRNMDWSAFRSYITLANRTRTYTIPEQLAEHIQSNYVENRQLAWSQAERLASPGTIPTPLYTQHDLERQLLIARLSALSLAPSSPSVTLSPSVWSHAQSLCFAASDSLNASSDFTLGRGLATSLSQLRVDSPPPCR